MIRLNNVMYMAGRVYSQNVYAATRWRLITNAFSSPLITLTPRLTLNSNHNPNSNGNRLKMRIIDHMAGRVYRHFGLD